MIVWHIEVHRGYKNVQYRMQRDVSVFVIDVAIFFFSFSGQDTNILLFYLRDIFMLP
jgi:hypothetical protein